MILRRLSLAFLVGILGARNGMAQVPKGPAAGAAFAPPQAFIENRGQWPDSVRYGWSSGGASASIGPQSQVTLYVSRRFGERSALVPVTSLAIDGLAPGALEGGDQLPTTYAFLKGQRAAWRLEVSAYDNLLTVINSEGRPAAAKWLKLVP